MHSLFRRRFLFAIASSIPLSRIQAAGQLNVGMVPDAGATQVSIEQKAPLRDYLTKALGEPANLIIPTNYNATVEALGNGSLDFAYLGALTYIKAHERYGVIPLVQRSLDKQFHSLFITQTNSSILSLTDLRGKNFAFGDINSTSGHLIPYAELRKAGIDVDRDLHSRYTGSHAATAKVIEAGAVDAGALDETVYHSMIAEKALDGSKTRVFQTSPAFVDYVWVGRKDGASLRRDKFINAFLNLQPTRDSMVLDILRGKSFLRVYDAEYANIRNIARQLQML